jgi:DNA-binding NarL/FixJ family response regulator
VFALFIMMTFFSKDILAMFKILIIDSNTLFRRSLGKSLYGRFPAVEIQEAGSGAVGLRKVGSFAPQLIFIDIYLPDISGYDLAKKIKSSYPEIIIAIFVSLDSPEYRAAAAQCGVEHLIPKDDWTAADILDWVQSTRSDYEISHMIKTKNEKSKT